MTLLLFDPEYFLKSSICGATGGEADEIYSCAASGGFGSWESCSTTKGSLQGMTTGPHPGIPILPVFDLEMRPLPRANARTQRRIRQSGPVNENGPRRVSLWRYSNTRRKESPDLTRRLSSHVGTDIADAFLRGDLVSLRRVADFVRAVIGCPFLTRLINYEVALPLHRAHHPT